MEDIWCDADEGSGRQARQFSARVGGGESGEGGIETVADGFESVARDSPVEKTRVQVETCMTKKGTGSEMV